MRKIELGVINRPFGLKGEMRVYSLTDFPELRFVKGTKMILQNNKGEETPVTLASYRDGKDFIFLSFEEITSIEEAEKHTRDSILIDEEAAPLPKGYYRNGDLEGCSVYDEEGNLLGQVKRVETNTPTSTLRVARKDEKDFFVPFIFDTFIVSVDLKNKKIVIKLMKGLL